MKKHVRVLSLIWLGLSAIACGDAGRETTTEDGGTASDAGTNDAAPVGPADPSSLVLALRAGTVQGKRAGAAREFLGIPYAKPPLGALRFMPPEPAEAWDGTLDATVFGPSCMQPRKLITPTGELSEDCLTLNVYAPDADSEPRPVMVWIHGGGFIGGGSNPYDGARLASEGGVIVVTVNHRLGAFGFFSDAALDAERGDAPSGNDGLLDQRLALRWVRDNIAAFGGDPSNVTLFGESAGGMSACMHFASPSEHELVHRFIIESGACVSSNGALSKEASRALSSELAAALCGDATDVLACLRGEDAQKLADWEADRTLLGPGWRPLFDANDPILPAAPLELIAQGTQNDGPLIVGTNANEWGLFAALSGTSVSSVSELDAALREQFASSEGIVPAILDHYAATDATAHDTYIRALTDALFRCPARTLARAATAGGNAAYLYSFEQGSAYHAFEIPYVFGTPNPTLGAVEVDPLHGAFAAYWTGFAEQGDPNVSGQPVWPAYENADEPYMRFVDPPQQSSGLATDDCDFWEGLDR